MIEKGGIIEAIKLEVNKGRPMTKKLLKIILVAAWLSMTAPFTLHADDYIVSKFSKLYHRPTCKKVKRIQEKNRITFTSVKEAKKTGHTPCRICKPPVQD